MPADARCDDRFFPAPFRLICRVLFWRSARSIPFRMLASYPRCHNNAIAHTARAYNDSFAVCGAQIMALPLLGYHKNACDFAPRHCAVAAAVVVVAVVIVARIRRASPTPQ